ncbi:MAG: ZIP family metal transporter, partial [Planctomycetota bacterium]
LPAAQDEEAGHLGIVGVLAGMAVMAVGLWVVHAAEPHDYLAEHHGHGDGNGGGEGAKGRSRIMRVGLLAALGIGIHNFPEGMAVFTGMLHGTAGLGLAVAVAIALHNIPEGLAVAAPIYAATGSRRKALGWCLLASLAEPAGALVAAVVLYPILSDTVMAGTLAVVAGIMVFISLDELLPAAQDEEAGHLGIVGVLAGMAVMAVGLWVVHAAEPHDAVQPRGAAQVGPRRAGQEGGRARGRVRRRARRRRAEREPRARPRSLSVSTSSPVTSELARPGGISPRNACFQSMEW